MNSVAELPDANRARRLWQQPTEQEWYHFIILDRAFSLIVNFSLSAPQHAGQPGPLLRISCMVHQGGQWRGTVLTTEATHIDELGVGISSPHGHIRGSERTELKLDIPELDLHLDTVLVSQTAAASTSEKTLGAGGQLNWIARPHLRANGDCRIGGQSRKLVDVPAYQDHNWGRFDWGGNFSWDWIVLLPHERRHPSLVYSGISDGAVTKSQHQGMMLCGEKPGIRVFQADELSVSRSGHLYQPNPVRVPAALGLAVPGQQSCMARQYHLEGRSRSDFLNVECVPGEPMQLLVPGSGDNQSLTIISEATGSAEVHGRINGQKLEFEATCVIEHARPCR
jgi:hypothetical protein